MDNTLDALRNLYVAMGGEASDVENLVITPDLINAIATLASTLATTVATVATEVLPEVTATDNGKVLTVVNGAWAAVLPE